MLTRERMIRRQQLRFMGMTLLAFTLIFTIFSIIVFMRVQDTLFTETDAELERFKEMIIANPEPEERENGPNGEPPDEREMNRPFNPRLIVLDWNTEGDIVNEEQIGTTLYESYFSSYSPDFSTQDTIVNMTIGETYHFRSLLFKDTVTGDGIQYRQLLISTDAEQTIIQNFGRLLVVFSVMFILLSISASYVLSRKMMKPIIRSWDKQTQFVENASHELRTPLTIIQNKLEMLLTTPYEMIMNKVDHIALSLSETRRLSKMTGDLLTLARADAEQEQLSIQPLELDSFLNQVSMPYEEVAITQHKRFWLDLTSASLIKADEARFHQLVVILLDNALKYTNERDSISLRTYTEHQKAVIEVADTGPGISDDHLPHIFERFYREDTSRSRDTGGSGLGLSIAQWIVHMHSGTISARRNEHGGTTFTIKWPIAY